jgi:hypothetical protein
MINGPFPYGLLSSQKYKGWSDTRSKGIKSQKNRADQETAVIRACSLL